MKLKEWDKVLLVNKNDPAKKLFKLTILNPTTIKRLTKQGNLPFKGNILDKSWGNFSNKNTISQILSHKEPFSSENFILIDVEICKDFFFKFKHKLKNIGYKIRLWFITTVAKNLYFKNPKKKN